MSASMTRARYYWQAPERLLTQHVVLVVQLDGAAGVARAPVSVSV